MKIRTAGSQPNPWKIVSSSVALPDPPQAPSSSLSSLIWSTRGTMKVSALVSAVLGSMNGQWSVSDNKIRNKLLDAYDSGNLKEASRMCQIGAGAVIAADRTVVDLVYRCLRGDIEGQAMNSPVKMSSRGSAIPGPVKTRVKNELHAIGLKRWPEIPLDEIFWALEKNGLMPLQEDGTRWSGILMGGKECGEPGAEKQRANFPIAMQSQNDAGEWIPTNTAVHLSWCLIGREPKRLEIVVYMG